MPVIYVVGIGPGGDDTITPQAMNVLRSCQVIAGYEKYIDMVRDLVPGKFLYSSPMKMEVERCRDVLKISQLFGYDIALISSGDSGVYGMAGLMLEIASGSGIDVKIIPGITAANSCAAILGAPLMNDYVTVSLSNHLTEWRIIEKRLIFACMGDFVICLYNPASSIRPKNFMNACDIILRYYDNDTPAGYVRNIGREGECSEVTTLEKIRKYNIDMFCTVVIGNSQTYILDGKMITPRGYKLE